MHNKQWGVKEMKLVAICGIDGSGKTTQIKMLKKYFINKERKFYATKSPSDWYRKSSRVIDYLRGNIEENAMIVNELALLSASDKLRQYQLEIKDREYQYVIFDRYIYSAYAYFICRGMELKYLIEINQFAPKPDATIYIDIDEELALRRVLQRDNQNANKEEKNIEFLKNVRNIFLNPPWEMDDNYYIIDGTRAVEEIHKDIIQIMESI